MHVDEPSNSLLRILVTIEAILAINLIVKHGSLSSFLSSVISPDTEKHTTLFNAICCFTCYSTDFFASRILLSRVESRVAERSSPSRVSSRRSRCQVKSQLASQVNI